MIKEEIIIAENEIPVRCNKCIKIVGKLKFGESGQVFITCHKCSKNEEI